jgi:hypothetical protein
MSRHGRYTETLLTEGMGGRMKRRGGQLVPLKQRMSEKNFTKRTARIAARRTVAAQLVGQMNLLRQEVRAFASMGMVQRWKLRRQLRKQAA